jgi:hypothetical protein
VVTWQWDTANVSDREFHDLALAFNGETISFEVLSCTVLCDIAPLMVEMLQAAVSKPRSPSALMRISTCARSSLYLYRHGASLMDATPRLH